MYLSDVGMQLVNQKCLLSVLSGDIQKKKKLGKHCVILTLQIIMFYILTKNPRSAVTSAELSWLERLKTTQVSVRQPGCRLHVLGQGLHMKCWENGFSLWEHGVIWALFCIWRARLLLEDLKKFLLFGLILNLRNILFSIIIPAALLLLALRLSNLGRGSCVN